MPKETESLMDGMTVEVSGEVPMEFLKVGRLPDLEANYARPELTASEAKVWEVLDDGRLKLRPEIVVSKQSPEFKAALRRGLKSGRLTK